MSEEKQMGVVSEEALDEIAGGFNVLGKDITKADVKKAFAYAGIGIGTAAFLAWAGKQLYDKYKYEEGSGKAEYDDDEDNSEFPGSYLDPARNYGKDLNHMFSGQSTKYQKNVKKVLNKYK